MQTTDDRKADKSMTYTLILGMFILFQLVSLDGLFKAEKYHARISTSWLLQFDIIAPWVFMAVVGIGIWRSAIRGKIERQTAGGLLLCLGFIIFYVYEALGKFAAGH